MGLDYYGILQITRTSTDIDIKKAYRSLALEFHPEMLKEVNAQKAFALIGEAYEVLKDPLRRVVFDQYGEEGLKRGVPGVNEYIQPYHYHGEPMRTYKEFFGTASPYANLLDYYHNPREIYAVKGAKGFRVKEPPITHPLCLSLHEMYFGGVKKMKIHRLVFINDEQSKTDLKEKILTIPIKPGLRAGTKLLFSEEGDQNPTQFPADIIFIVSERPHETYTRKEDNLIMYVDISLEEALSGTVVTVKTIDRRTIRIPITDIIHPAYEKIVKGEGMPILQKYPEKGNLIIRFNLHFPNYLPKASKDLLKQSFYLAKINGINQPGLINEIILTDKILNVERSDEYSLL